MNASPPVTPADGVPLVEASNLVKSFRLRARSIEVLRGVSLLIRRGEAAAIVGASGSGKTTLLHVLAGLDRPTGGVVRFEGVDLYALPPRERTALRARRIGLVFQAYHLLPELTVLENVALPARTRWRGPAAEAAIRRRAAELIAQVGLGDRMAHRPAELSGGEQQRAAIARALINDPDVLFADEPTGNLDSASGEAVLRSLFDLAAGGRRTVLLVTHNPDIAARCDRLFTLRDGRVLDGAGR